MESIFLIFINREGNLLNGVILPGAQGRPSYKDYEAMYMDDKAIDRSNGQL